MPGGIEVFFRAPAGGSPGVLEIGLRGGRRPGAASGEAKRCPRLQVLPRMSSGSPVMMTETTGRGRLDVLDAIGTRGDGHRLAGRRAGRADPDGPADGRRHARGVGGAPGVQAVGVGLDLVRCGVERHAKPAHPALGVHSTSGHARSPAATSPGSWPAAVASSAAVAGGPSARAPAGCAWRARRSAARIGAWAGADGGGGHLLRVAVGERAQRHAARPRWVVVSRRRACRGSW